MQHGSLPALHAPAGCVASEKGRALLLVDFVFAEGSARQILRGTLEYSDFSTDACALQVQHQFTDINAKNVHVPRPLIHKPRHTCSQSCLTHAGRQTPPQQAPAHTPERITGFVSTVCVVLFYLRTMHGALQGHAHTKAEQPQPHPLPVVLPLCMSGYTTSAHRCCFCW